MVTPLTGPPVGGGKPMYSGGGPGPMAQQIRHMQPRLMTPNMSMPMVGQMPPQQVYTLAFNKYLYLITYI